MPSEPMPGSELQKCVVPSRSDMVFLPAPGRYCHESLCRTEKTRNEFCFEIFTTLIELDAVQ